MYESPIIKEQPKQEPSEPIYVETEPEYDDAVYAQKKLEEYQAAKRPVYAEINKNRWHRNVSRREMKRFY